MNSLTANKARSEQQWVPPTPIEVLFKHLKDSQDSTISGNENISDSQLVYFGYDIMTNTGVLGRLCTKFRNQKPTDQTWDKFKTHFTTAVKDYDKNKITGDVKYSATYVQELVDQRISQYIIKDPAPPEPPTPPEAAAHSTQNDN